MTKPDHDAGHVRIFRGAAKLHAAAPPDRGVPMMAPSPTARNSLLEWSTLLVGPSE